MVNGAGKRMRAHLVRRELLLAELEQAAQQPLGLFHARVIVPEQASEQRSLACTFAQNKLAHALLQAILHRRWQSIKPPQARACIRGCFVRLRVSSNCKRLRRRRLHRHGWPGHAIRRRRTLRTRRLGRGFSGSERLPVGRRLRRVGVVVAGARLEAVVVKHVLATVLQLGQERRAAERQRRRRSSRPIAGSYRCFRWGLQFWRGRRRRG